MRIIDKIAVAVTGILTAGAIAIPTVAVADTPPDAPRPTMWICHHFYTSKGVRAIHSERIYKDDLENAGKHLVHGDSAGKCT